MMNKVLIANRGEIAVRIIRTCHEMGIKTVAIYSEPDKEAMHVKMANESVCIGPANPQKSYLLMNNIIQAAIQKKVDAIHPGFGFLSENAEFARICEDIKIMFVGPSANAIDLLGNKQRAKQVMEEYGVSVIPGPQKSFIIAHEALKEALTIGFPIMIKAVSGGGGRGIRVIFKQEDFVQSFQEASHEAKIAFGDPSIYLEKYLENPKHIEFQMLGDSYGDMVCFGERDCSSQRRKQKIVEESPTPLVTEKKREEIIRKLNKALSAIGYSNAGTVEFLYENGNFYFMEMNTRIQVEHPVTELAYSVDLIKEQLKIASGERLQYKQSDIVPKACAIEARINAEDPENNFMPHAGKITQLIFPGGHGIRVDSFLYPGYIVLPFYDSMLAKIIAYAPTRNEAIAKLIRAMDELAIDGIKTNKHFVKEILFSEGFLKGSYSINYIEKELMKKLKKDKE